MSHRQAPRTSKTHPLRIDDMAIPGVSGIIGMTLCPGRCDRISIEGEWKRDLGADLDVIAQWRPALIIALLESAEFKQLGIPTYFDEVRARGMVVRHLPIVDGGIPDQPFEQTWEKTGPEVRSLLRKGGRVLVHCRAGLGRTGTIAARLLVELGSESDFAIQTVRAARSSTIETGPQEEHVRRVRPILDTVVPSRISNRAHLKLDQSIVDRALGCFIGLAVGDALGTTLEFSKRDSRPPLTDMVGGGPFSLKPGEWTDDTSMAICLAESLIAFPNLSERDLMERFARWRETGENSVNGTLFDIGTTTSAAISRFLEDNDPIAGICDPRYAGNGSLMRLAPVALRWLNDPHEASFAALKQSATTHAAPAALESCSLFARVLVETIATGQKATALAKRSAAHPDVERIAQGSWHRDRKTIRSGGYVLDTLEAAFWAISNASSFEEAVLLAANLGDDADTVAAVTGQLAGALWGLSSIPHKWLNLLAQRDRLEDLGWRLIMLAERDVTSPSEIAAHDAESDQSALNCGWFETRSQALANASTSTTPNFDDLHWSYIRAKDVVELWGPDSVLLQDLVVAGELLRARLGQTKLPTRLNLVPSTYRVLEERLEDFEVTSLLDKLLQRALRQLGVKNGGREMCSYGMGSDYRGWLGYARRCAETYLLKTPATAKFQAKRYLAEEIVACTHAVAFATRYTYATLPFTTAVAVSSLRSCLPQRKKSSKTEKH